MEQENRSGSIKKVLNLVSQWFTADEQASDEGMSGSPDRPPMNVSEDIRLEAMPDHGEISQTTMTISEKLTILKNALEFDTGLGSRLAEVKTVRELLLYFHDVLLFRFGKLREIGLMNQESGQLIHHLDRKTTSMLARADSAQSAGDDEESVGLRRENEELKNEVATLHAKYLKTGIITDSELALEKEVKYLQSRIREQQTKIDLARKRLKALFPFQEMVQSLRARNSILESKVDHQARILRSLTAKEPKNKELVSNIERLRAENRQLKSELENQSGLWSQIKKALPQDPGSILDELMKSNTKLSSELEMRQEQMEEALSAIGSNEDLMEAIDRLGEENAHLKGRLDTRQRLRNGLENHMAGKSNMEDVAQILAAENRQLGFTLQAREEQIQVLASESCDRPAVKAYWQLQHKYRQLLRESEAKENLYTQTQDEREDLVAQARERAVLIKENQRLKSEIESARRNNDALKKLASQYEVIKRESAGLRTKCDALTVKNTDLERKLSRISTEYKVLLKEYENVFGVT